MSKAKFHEDFTTNYAECEFNLNETVSQLKHDYGRFCCWGVSKLTNYYNKGLLLSVNGRHLKGFVLITLAGDDTYTVRFFNTKYNEVKEMMSNVYCDELTKRIDDVIEYVPEYKF